MQDNSDKAHYKFTPEQVIRAIKGSGGFVTEIARRLGCARSTVYTYRKRYPEVQQAFHDEREAQLDFAESALLNQIKDGNIAATIFFLKTQGKHRGYIERPLVEVNANAQVGSEREDNAKADASYVKKVMAELDKLGLKPSASPSPLESSRLNEKAEV